MACKHVRDIPDNFQFISDSQDVKPLNDDFCADYDAYFISVHEGEIVSAYGMYGIVPELNKRLYEVKL